MSIFVVSSKRRIFFLQ